MVISKPSPPKTITADGIQKLNPVYVRWAQQDRLLLSATIRSISPEIISFITNSETSRHAWDTLHNTYNKSSRGRILALKNRLHNPTKGSRSISEFMHEIKTLNGLDSYKEIGNAIQTRDSSISFDELHDKLLSIEAQLSSRSPSVTSGLTTAFMAAQNSSKNGQSNSKWGKNKPGNNYS